MAGSVQFGSRSRPVVSQARSRHRRDRSFTKPADIRPCSRPVRNSRCVVGHLALVPAAAIDRTGGCAGAGRHHRNRDVQIWPVATAAAQRDRLPARTCLGIDRRRSHRAVASSGHERLCARSPTDHGPSRQGCGIFRADSQAGADVTQSRPTFAIFPVAAATRARTSSNQCGVRA